MSRKQRLELTWIGKHDVPRPEPRILIEDKALSHSVSNDCADNMLIHGDNLLALKALEAQFADSIKCIYIDPPYNTGSAFEQYDDGREHSIWMTLIYHRLLSLKPLLAPDGSIWVSIDDREMPYLRAIMDEVFGRENFIAQIIWQKVLSVKNSARHFSIDHDYILVYARDAEQWKPNPMAGSEKQQAAYKNLDNDPRGPWQSVSLSARNYYSKGSYPVHTPSGRLIDGPPPGRYWSISEESLRALDREGRIWWGKTNDGVPRRKVFLSEVGELTKIPQTLWMFDDVGHTQDAKKESVALFGEMAFATPKPERLMRRIVELATVPGDWVLDSFAGSGTTGAVAHKLGRRWIMIEQGPQALSHVIPRLKKVVVGNDRGGISDAVEWNGGGGFRYFRLAPSLIERDQWGNNVISRQYNPVMLAEAMCKLMGFDYAPDPDHFWIHGRSTERDFIYVTTAALTHEQLKKISDLVGPERTLLVCCRAFQKEHVSRLENLTVRKIPQAVLSKCEWGKDDYSMGLAETAPPTELDEVTDVTPNAEASEAPKPRKRKKPRPRAPQEPTLFDEEESKA